MVIDKQESTSIHKDFLERYHLFNEQNCLVYYNGPILYSIITEYGFFLRHSISQKYSVRQSVFYIFVELAQNIKDYSIEKGPALPGKKANGIGSFSIYEDDTFFYITMSNLVSKEQYDNIQKRYQKLKSYQRDEIIKMRTEYRAEVLHDKSLQSGNIGLINVALKSENGILIDFYDINDHQKYYIITASVSK